MNFLQLVQRLHAESGSSGAGPVAVTNQRGEALRMVNWIKRADTEIQNKWLNWKFLWVPTKFQGTATADNATLAAPTTPSPLAMWDFDTFRLIEAGSTDESPIEAVEYEYVKTEILSTDSDVPSRVIVMPDNSLKLDPIPNDAHVITADWYREPIELAANTDVSAIPAKFHLAIVGLALVYYANFENAPEQKAQGGQLYTEFLEKLESHQLPNQKYARSRTNGVFEVIGSQ